MMYNLYLIQNLFSEIKYKVKPIDYFRHVLTVILKIQRGQVLHMEYLFAWIVLQFTEAWECI